MKYFSEEIIQTAAFILVGVLGGLVKYLREIKTDLRKFSVIQMIITVITGGFLGMLTYFLGNSLSMDGAMIGFMSGVAGLMGDEAIKVYISRFKRGS